MNTENATLIGATARFSKKKMSPTSDRRTMCPAVMFANKRIINANGFVSNDTISIGTMIGARNTGAPPNK